MITQFNEYKTQINKNSVYESGRNLALPQYKMNIDDINKIKDVFDIENITNMSIGLKLICLGEYGDLFVNPEDKRYLCV